MVALLRFLPQGLGVLLIISAIANYALWNRLQRTEAHAETDRAECTARMADSIASAAQAGASAQNRATEEAFERMRHAMTEARKRAREAEHQRELAVNSADQLRERLNKSLQENRDAEAWDGATLPLAIDLLLDET